MLWAAVLGGPFAWLACFGISFALQPWACAYGWRSLPFAVAVTSILLTGGFSFLGAVLWRQLGSENPGEAADVLARSRLMAIGGMLLSGISLLIAIAQLIVQSVLRACD